jgi:anti-sigma B factor antagonist
MAGLTRTGTTEEAMELSRHPDGRLMIARPAEQRIDARVAAELKQQLLELVSAHAAVALDLSAVEFIDSSGLGAIVSALKHAEGRAQLVIVGARPAVLSLFRLTRVDRIVRMFPASADAVAALAH